MKKATTTNTENVMKTFSYTIEQDTDAQNPREEFDHVGRMVCWHRRYTLSDKGENKSFPTVESFEEWRAPQKDEETGDLKQDPEACGLLVLPLYLYDHSGISMRTASFSCPWDSGQVGYIYATAETIAREFGNEHDKARAKEGKRLRRKLYKQAEKCLRAEVEEFNAYLTGDIYGYVLRDDVGEHVDSCWGFYGREYCEEQAKEAKRCAEEQEAKRMALEIDRETFGDFRAGGAL